MNKIVIAFFALSLISCTTTTPEKKVIESSKPLAGVANPASVNCIDKGGKLDIRTETAGQYGVCVFDDKSECEEWKFFRGECKKGDSLKK